MFGTSSKLRSVLNFDFVNKLKCSVRILHRTLGIDFPIRTSRIHNFFFLINLFNMKKIFTLCVTVWITMGAQAQIKDIRVAESSMKASFINVHRFYNSDGSSIAIHFFSADQLDSLLMHQNLFQKVWASIQPVVQQPKYAYSMKRVDYLYWGDSSTFRVKEVSAHEESFLYKEGRTIPRKPGRDTLRLMLQNKFTASLKDRKAYQMYYVTVTVNDLQDLSTMSDQTLQDAVAAAKASMASVSHKFKNPGFQENYHLQDGRWVKYEHKQMKQKKSYVEPDIYVGFQHVRNAWVTSAAAGVKWIRGSYFKDRKEFKLLWEPHFLFVRNTDDNLRIRRNDFITFRYYEYSVEESEKFDIPITFSFGYLVGRKGDLYEKNTFKFSIPGLGYRGLLLEPEFFFHDFFKQFSPSIKLSYNID